ncbi:MAG: carotenoid oxygenase family protein [Pseudomonadales bacterium]
MNVVTEGSNEAPSCHGGLENLDEEYSYWIDSLEGEVPSDLRGTFFRNGPGRQKIGGNPYGHWFDGDGMLCAFSFIDGKVHFKNSYVRTPKYLEETQAQKILYRGFGTQIPGGLRANFLKMPANPANTSIIHHGGKLLALNEGGRPWALDPGTLETLGEFDYDGMLTKANVFSAHGKVHQRTGDLINFGAGISGFGWRGPKPCINVYRINPQGRMINKGHIPLSTFPFCHDFALTDRYGVFFINSIVFGGMLNVMLGRNTISDQVSFDQSQPMRVVVIDLDTLETVRTFETDPGAIIHFGNAFEQGDEIVVDGMFADNFEANKTLADVFNPDGRFGGGVYNRYTLNMVTGAFGFAQVSEHESEFPTFNTRKTGEKHEACYTACSIDNGANSFFNAIQKVSFDGDSTLVTLPPGYYGSEPMFAPSTTAEKEDDGYVLEVVYDAYKHKSELQIYRADSLSDQVCSLHLKHHVPHQFHGHFSEEVFIAPDAV